MSEVVRRHDEGGVITVTFTREAKLNAVNLEMLEALEQAADDLYWRDEHKVLVITAEGRYFTAGRDMSEVDVGVDQAEDYVPDSHVRRTYRTVGKQDFFDFLETIEKPIVMAVQGPCMGIGVEMSASCDFRLCSDEAWFSLPEVPNLALIPASGAISRLTRQIGQPWLKWMAMAGQRIDAQQALAIGYVQAVYPAATFADDVQAFARHLASLPGEAMGVAKLTINAAEHVDRRMARDMDRIVQTSLFRNPEHRAKLEAFANRPRQPKA